MSSIRSAHDGRADDDFNVYDDFIGFYRALSTAGADLLYLIEDALLSLNLAHLYSSMNLALPYIGNNGYNGISVAFSVAVS